MLDAIATTTTTRKVRRAKRAQRLTDRAVTALAKHADRYWVWDKPRDVGLAVLVLPSGAKSFHCYFQRGPGLPMKSLKLGNTGEMTVEEARDAARDMRRKVAEGKDPRADDVRRTGTFSDMVDDWYSRSLKGKVSGLARKNFVLHHTGKWHTLPVGTIRQADVEALLQHTMNTVSAETARSLQNALMTVFAWAIEDEEAYPNLARNPVKRASSYGWLPEKARRQLSWFKGKAADDLLGKVWRYASTCNRSEELFIKLLVLTGKRINAVDALSWSQVSDEWLWVPVQVDGMGNRKKKKANNPVPLPKVAQQLLGERGQGKLCFVDAGRLMRRVREAIGEDTFIFHGLRHLIKTRLAELRLALPHVRDIITDHVDSSRSAAGRGYEHGTDYTEVAEALEGWAAHVLACAHPKPVLAAVA
jgi:integrase